MSVYHRCPNPNCRALLSEDEVLTETNYLLKPPVDSVICSKCNTNMVTYTNTEPKTIHFRKRTIIAMVLLIILASVSLVYAATYILYDWNLTMTSATPDVRFIRWSDSGTVNTMTLNYSIYQDAWTYDENASYGVTNGGGSSATVYVYVNNINDTTKVANVTVQIKTQNGTVLLATTTWEGGALPTSEQSWTAEASTHYLIRVWIQGASSVADVQIEMRLKV